ncbi:UDP-glucose 4-epimerase GalE [Paracoccus sp. MC1862]|uniref:UDP-glucose 4-epimerase GalE n=1 Tax=Paracoccus sp. MC1862 TaxID=2760307 RepID=UPI00160242AB|nr:UDP-glucose 4-epimerase GalE [Paracoccus sp. MC1862]MBB1498030.1 UDP-glucose 4-epimerase GalE [Paracoccus sp. MC1862]QQO43526.1 UDP-glucose 4-epimerase GalE [Paracoccus sp. MC1862]
MKKCILATGGAGYIGSHVVVELLEAGHRVVILDNFENSDRGTVERISRIARGEVELVEGDVRDPDLVVEVLRLHRVDAVIHLAGKKAVGESVADPLLYFHDNLLGAVSLLQAMCAAGVQKLVFSSSATVYGFPKTLPIPETAPTGVTNPYGRTKLMIEEIIDDLTVAEPDFQAISLRYFNPVGAHPSGLIGENPRGTPNNLFPYVAQTAAGLRKAVQVFGSDYDTIDGTGTRDYIHVLDLARGHVAAINHLFGNSKERHLRINLGTGTGYSVLQILDAFSDACGHRIPREIVARRPGDAAASLADPTLAHRLLGWHATHDLRAMCADHWAFQKGLAAAEGENPVAAHAPQRHLERSAGRFGPRLRH